MATNFDDHAWDPDHALASLAEETSLVDGEDTTATAERLLRAALPGATASLINTALYSINESNRMKASAIIMDRCMGTVSSVDPLGRSKDPLEKLVEEIYAHTAKEA
jgi:hypothetical protein